MSDQGREAVTTTDSWLEKLIAALDALYHRFGAAPRSPDERASVEDTAFMRCAQAAIDLAASYESDLRDAVFAYFLELAAMRPRRRAMLEASIAGALVGLGMGS